MQDGGAGQRPAPPSSLSESIELSESSSSCWQAHSDISRGAFFLSGLRQGVIRTPTEAGAATVGSAHLLVRPFILQRRSAKSGQP